MRTFTVVPSFDGDSAFFELPDIGFQGDNLSFAILFNLTELTEHWPDIVPSMIVTDPNNNTFIAPHTAWNSTNHIFTWYISEIETAYKGTLRCQLKCIKADDPDAIVCMSRICQTRVYESLEAASDAPEAFQSWLDTLVRLGAEINEDAVLAQQSMEVTEVNALTAQAAAQAAEESANEAEEYRDTTLQAKDIAVASQQAASQAQQKSEAAQQITEAAKDAAVAAKEVAEEVIEEVDLSVRSAAQSASSALDSAEQAANSMSASNTAKLASEAARDASIAAQGKAENAQAAAETAQGKAEDAQAAAETAQGKAEDAQAAAETAQGKAEDAQVAAETAQGKAEDAQVAAETAQGKAEDAQVAAETAQAAAETAEDLSKRWAIGVGRDGMPVGSTDQTYQNNSKYWSDEAKSARDTILGSMFSSAFYAEEDESITIVLGGERIIDYSENAN